LAAKKGNLKSPFLMFRNKPLVRCGNIIYYGDLNEKYILMFQILSSKEENGLKISDKILVQLQYTDQDIRSKDRVVKKTEKNGLYNAIDIGTIWLSRALDEI
jgi:hypothetical protein